MMFVASLRLLFYTTMKTVWVGLGRYERPTEVRDFHYSLFRCNADRVKEDRTDVNLEVHSNQMQKRDAEEIKLE